ncbi:MAG TPA: translation initiation factor IF-2 [Bacteroidales bacterium]|nr:translation initiation factor IF-2 [Bacteroidales bacterium]HQD34511.1 translation initiation factor IF-2 [Bacteroidales bacterium]
MNEIKTYRLNQLTRELGVTFAELQELLKSNGIKVNTPNDRISEDAYLIIKQNYNLDTEKNKTDENIVEETKTTTADKIIEQEQPKETENAPFEINLKVKGKIDLNKENERTTKEKSISSKSKEKEEKTKSKKPKIKNIEKSIDKELETDNKQEVAENQTESQLKITSENITENELVTEKIVDQETPQAEILDNKTGQETDITEINKDTKEITTDISDKPYLQEINLKVKYKIDLDEVSPKKSKTNGNEKKQSSRPRKKTIKKVAEADQKGFKKWDKNHTTTDQTNKEKPKPRYYDNKDTTNKVGDKSQPKKREKTNKKFRDKDFQHRRKREENVLTDEEITQKIKETLAKAQAKPKTTPAQYKKLKREQRLSKNADNEVKNVIEVTEFITTSELASLMNVSPTEVIAKCFDLGLTTTINSRLDAETIVLVADEFGYEVKFISLDEKEEEEYDDDPSTLLPRHPVVTVMGHVDHGKTKLLDFIRKTNVVAGEAGGITQHIGAYEVTLQNGRKITFLDTPGHEAFTAMRARGAKVTDIAIIVIAADEQVMPQTVEAINHARAAGVPMIFAINKIDKPNANPEKIKEQLANMNILVEDWGGNYQSQEISAKEGLNVDKLLEKVLLQADLMDLKANPNRPAIGTVIESGLEKGRGYVATILIHNGTLHIGDPVLAGVYYGKVRAMFDERNQPKKEAGPSSPALILGLNGAPQAGDKLLVMPSEKEAKDKALKRQQLLREQSIRAKKHITLDEIGRRIAIGDFKELNLIVKGDVDGSVEALSDSLLKLSNEHVQVNVIHKGVGAITESDILLAAASNAIIVAFQVRPAPAIRKLAEQEQIQIKSYSIIYDAIEEIKSAIEGMLEPTIEETILGTAEVKQVFSIKKVGNIAGCMVLDGKIDKNARVRLIRNGIVIFDGEIISLKRFQNDVREVLTGQDCGIGIKNFNDIKVGDLIEAYITTSVEQKL